MRLGGCVILYNPTLEVIDNVMTYLPILEWLICVDNSDSQSEAVGMLGEIENVEVVNMGGNKGVASGLNVGCRRLIELGCDVALTMDQDSKFPLDESGEILAAVNRLLGDHAIVGLNYNSDDCGDSDETVEVKYWLTSGNFLKLDAYEDVGGFMDELFIDYVDIEFGHRLHAHGRRVCYLKNHSLQHSIGDPIEIHMFGKAYYAMNHSPVRYYYRYRNSRYLFGTDITFYFDKYWRELFVNIPKMLLFERNRLNKLKMIHQGLKDGGDGRLGKFQGGPIAYICKDCDCS